MINEPAAWIEFADGGEGHIRLWTSSHVRAQAESFKGRKLQPLYLQDEDLRAKLKAAEQALDRCVDYIEADELAHGRTYGAGVEGRQTLHLIRGTKPDADDVSP